MVLTKESPLKPQKSLFSPDRFLYGLLGIVSMLLLGDRFHWLGLGSQKGYTVLAAAAIVAATTTFVLLWLIASLLFRWRFQFGIRSLLVCGNRRDPLRLVRLREERDREATAGRRRDKRRAGVVRLPARCFRGRSSERQAAGTSLFA